MRLVGVPDTEFLAFGELVAPNRPTNCSEPCARHCFKCGHVRYVELGRGASCQILTVMNLVAAALVWPRKSLVDRSTGETPCLRQLRIRLAANLVVQSSTSTGLRLFGNERIRTGHDHLGRPVPILLATKWAGEIDRMEWELLHSCRNIQPTALAHDNELLSVLHHTSHAAGLICEHFSVAGEWDSAVFLPT